MGIPPHWHLIHNGQEGGDIAEWSKKQKSAFWRGGSNRRFGGVIRKELMSCPASAPEALKVCPPLCVTIIYICRERASL